MKRAMAAHLNELQMEPSFGQIRVTLGEDGLREVTPSSELFVKWAFVTNVATEQNHVFFRLANGHVVIPERESYSGTVPFDQLAPLVRHLADEVKKVAATSNF
jgi:hypothetical protein